MTDKTLIGIGLAAVATPVLAFCLFGGLNGHHAPAPRAEAAASSRSSAVPAPAVPPVVSRIAQPPVPPETPLSGIPVTPADLEKLARIVDLTESPDQGFKKDRWKRAIPVAEKLLRQSADCEQRNWLTQFVRLGNLALEESPEYREFAPVLATMYRNDEELLTGVPSD